MTIYLPVPQHLAYVAWTRTQQVSLAKLMTASSHDRLEAVRRMARIATVEPVVALTVDSVLAPDGSTRGGVLQAQAMTFEWRHGDGPLLPGVHGSGRPSSTVLAVGMGPTPTAARADLIARVDVLLRPEGSAPTETLTLIS